MVKQVILTEEEYNELVEKANDHKLRATLDSLLQDERYIILDMTKLKNDLLFSQTNSCADPLANTISAILKINFDKPHPKETVVGSKKVVYVTDYINNQHELPQHARLKLIELYGICSIDLYNFIKQNDE